MPGDAAVAEQYRLDASRPLVLSIGGIEARKNPLRLLRAFVQLRRTHHRARLLMVGGASLLDHHAIQQDFVQLLSDSGLAAGPNGPVTLTGPLPDAQIAPLLRLADVVAFPSLHEGFGLVVLEALACGTPVVVSRIAPFTEYLTSSSVRFADPLDPASIAAALREALDPWVRAGLRPNGLALAARMGWAPCAERQERLYFSLMDNTAPGRALRPERRYLSDTGGCHA
jgi:glycosyltransferase involved in cell wall biosynthesis